RSWFAANTASVHRQRCAPEARCALGPPTLGDLADGLSRRGGVDGHAAHVAALAGIVVQGEVPDGAVVPEGHRAGPPGEAAGEGLVARVLEQEVEQRLRLATGPA